jgi:hypothetical protein
MAHLLSYLHRAFAASVAIADRSAGDSRAARASAPARPLRTLPDDMIGASSISPVAMRMTVTAQPIKSAGRFCPCGPFGILSSLFHHTQPQRSTDRTSSSI